MQFNEWLYNKRTDNGYTMQELANKMGTGKSQVWEMEQPGSNPRMETLVKVANAFGLEVWRMFKQIEK